jgi:hypothetical protein
LDVLLYTQLDLPQHKKKRLLWISENPSSLLGFSQQDLSKLKSDKAYYSDIKDDMRCKKVSFEFPERNLKINSL